MIPGKDNRSYQVQKTTGMNVFGDESLQQRKYNKDMTVVCYLN